MKKFFVKLFFISLPITILIEIFILFDPFRIIYNYNDYSDNPVVQINRDFVSSEMYIKNHNKYRYDSFILGSSRTIAYRTSSWKKYLPKNARPFKFDASSESIYGIYTKIKYLDHIGANLNNCLLIICTDATFARDSDDENHIFIKDPEIVGTSKWHFYMVCIKDFMNFEFLKNYLKYLVTKKYEPSMDGFIEHSRIKFDLKTNDFILVDRDKELSVDENQYYFTRKSIFYERDSTNSQLNEQISLNKLKMLIEIESIFLKHHTQYKLVISPLYDQKELNNKDLTTLQKVFGKNRVFNFSGKNIITEDKENYYENSHYRPFIGDLILKKIYIKQTKFIKPTKTTHT